LGTDELRGGDRAHGGRERCPLLQHRRGGRAGGRPPWGGGAQGETHTPSIGGGTAPKRSDLGAAAPKDKLIARLRETFQFCESALAKVSDSGLGEKVPYFGTGEVSRGQAMVAAAEEGAGHYSQVAVYLRLNGLLPPSAKPRAE